jgi:long-chain acyl-CoA synthetase
MSEKITRLFDFITYQQKHNPIDKALVTKYNGKWIATSTQEFIDKANQLSRGLLRLGIKPNDKVAIISSSNRTEWNLLDIAILQIGAQNVPIYPTISSKDYEYIFNHAEVNYCFLSDETLYEKANAIKSNVNTLKEIYSFDDIKGCKSWKDILKLGKDSSNQKEVESLKNSVKEDDLATLIYTSGTTGTPKGVMLSHKNIVSNVLASKDRLPLIEGESIVLSFLPVCHIFERMLHYLYIYSSTTIYFAESIEKIKDNLNEVHPNLMSVVPRLLEKIYDGIIAKGTELSGIKKALFFWAVEVGLKYEPYGKNGWFYEKKLELARKLIFSKWKAALGGNLHTMVSGSAALQPRIARIFCAAGMNVMEGYGLTETSPVVTVNEYENNGFKIGTVGKAIDKVEIKIADDDEILIKGPNVMLGYYKNEEATREVIDEDGWFHTGDAGYFIDGKFLKINGRKKEIFKLSSGKYIAPQLIENKLKSSPLIEHAMVIGENKKFASAIISPNFDYLHFYASKHKIHFNDNKELVENKQVIKRFQREINEINKQLAQHENIKRFKVVPDAWSSTTRELTATLKLKRNYLHKKYEDIIKEIYKTEQEKSFDA